MSAKVVIVSPELAPGSGGLADYTLRLVEEWRDRLPVHVVVPGRDPLPTGTARVLLQYSGYGFSRFGYPRALL
ncbi:MAG: hypothetical protein M3032_07985, partial [Verrucomicrobiota bacterium]|nr:hypothetical protein [Verrucomicrobiota bacterium]